MSTFTVEIQVSNEDETAWQVVSPAETVSGKDGESAEDVARWVATNQAIADGDHWRVVVWNGVYDMAGEVHRDSDAEFYADQLR